MDTKKKFPNAASITKQYKGAIEGMENAWPATQPTITILGVNYTPQDLIAKLKGHYAPLKAAVKAKADYDAAIIVRNDELPGAQAFIEAFFSVLPHYLGANSADITKFGGKLRKERAALTIEQKKAAAEKAAKTRAARHIMGKRQRAAIKVA